MEAFVFLISLPREKSGLQRATSCSLQENASCSLADRRVCEPKSRAIAARRQPGRILVFFSASFYFPPWSNPVWISKTLRFSLLGVCWEGWLFALDTWDFLGGDLVFGFRDGWGLVQGMNFFVCVHESAFCSNAHVGGGGLECLWVLGKRILPDPRKWRWFCSWEAWV